jgi:hypothetical protein
MIRTQIYITEKEQRALRRIARLRKSTQSEIIREAVDEYLASFQNSNRVNLMQVARGIWADRNDFDSVTIREEFDRSFSDDQ